MNETENYSPEFYAKLQEAIRRQEERRQWLLDHRWQALRIWLQALWNRAVGQMTRKPYKSVQDALYNP